MAVNLVYTDGSCFPNPGGPGASAFAILRHHRQRKPIKASAYAFRPTTNNRAETIAVLEALKVVDLSKKTVIFTDSKYVKNILNGRWRAQANLDLWEQIRELVEGRNVHAEWVKGHNGNKWNEYVDRLCAKAVNGGAWLMDQGYEEANSLS